MSLIKYQHPYKKDALKGLTHISKGSCMLHWYGPLKGYPLYTPYIPLIYPTQIEGQDIRTL